MKLLSYSHFSDADNTSSVKGETLADTIRVDDWEMPADVQTEVDKLMAKVNNDNIKEICDLSGYKHDFYATNGFDVEGIDYTADVARMDQI